jgi:hypothetical protein
MTGQIVTITSMPGFFMEEWMGNRLKCRKNNHIRAKFTISSFLEEGRIM